MKERVITVGQLIAELMLKKKLSNNEIAERTNKTAGAISQIKTRDNKVNVENVKEIMEAMGEPMRLVTNDGTVYKIK